MRNVKFIHTADLHLDTPFKGLTSWNPDLAEKLKDATFNSFCKIVDLSVSENVDFLLIAGDVFDSGNMSLAAQLRFIKQLDRLSVKGISVFIVCGNHDYFDSWSKSFKMPDNVFRFGTQEVGRFKYTKDGIPVADIYGISYGKSSVYENLAGKFEISTDPAPISVAMFHGLATEIAKDSQYSPFSLEDIVDKPFDYWALGHVHKRNVLSDFPAVVYPGNPQGRDFGETGVKGCYLVELAKDEKPVLKFVPVCRLRFEEIELDISSYEDLGMLNSVIEHSVMELRGEYENMSSVLRIKLSGQTRLHAKLSQPGELDRLTDYYNDRQLDHEIFCWIDSIELNTSLPADVSALKQGNSFAADLLKLIDQYQEDPELLRELINEIHQELPESSVIREIGAIDKSENHKILEKAKWLLLNSLIGNSVD